MLISTGSKELHLYTRIKDYKERCFARVLSTQEAVAEAVRLGFEGKHLIAMQGSLFGRTESGNAPKTYKCSLFCDERIRRRRRVRGKEKGGAESRGGTYRDRAPERRRKKPSRGEKTYGRIPCKGKSSMIYYECCKKTRMRLSPSVPKPENPDGLEENKTCGSKKPIWRKETWALFQ